MPPTAAELGYHMPAEWEPLARVWLTPPHNPETWPGCLPDAQAQFQRFMLALAHHVPIATTDSLAIPTNDSWIRDFGPIFVTRNQETGDRRQETNLSQQTAKSQSAISIQHSEIPAALAAHDFIFNGWGNKYEHRGLDDQVPLHIAQHLNIPLFQHDLVLEGGSIEVNGRGTVMTTAQCLLSPNRNPHLTQAQIEQHLHDALGTSHCIWLPGGIVGDDTDGHIDDIARFIAPDTVVTIHAPGRSHPDHDMLAANRRALENARAQDGRKLTLIDLPVPDPILYDFPPDRFGPGGVHPVPASYANFLFANQAVLVPLFNQKTDDHALRVLEQALPHHTILGLPADRLVVGLGAFHCLSQQEPAV